LNPRQCCERLHSIEEKLIVQPISPDERNNLVHELEEVSHVIEELEAQATFINRFAASYFKELKDTIVTLYGKIDDSILKYRVSIIEKDAQQLEAFAQAKDFKQLASIVDTLRCQISSLFHTYAPTFEDRRVVAFAQLQLQKATALLEGKPYFDPFLDLEGWSYAETEAVLETVADLLSQNERKAARLLFSQLSPAQRKLLSAYLAPGDMLLHLLHDVEGPADHHQLIAG
jgi:hypothetical protein